MSDDSCNVAFDVAGLSAQLFTVCNFVFLQLLHSSYIILVASLNKENKVALTNPVE